jgi:DNA-binding NarL/FixJ family response regulator
MSLLTAPTARPDTPARPPGPPKLSGADLRRAQAETLRTPRFRYSIPAILTPAVTRRLIAEFALRTRSPRQLPHLDELTPREREVLALIATGLSNDEISRQIYISPATVKTHASRAMTKLGARDRAQLVVFAYQAGLAHPG